MDTHDKNTQTISNLDEQDQAQPATSTSRQGDEASAGASRDAEMKALEDKYLRLAAEFENYKRLSQRDQREQSKFANETLLRELLPILDNLQRAVQFAKADAQHSTLLEGVELTLKQFLETLGRFGVKPVKSVEEPFDPSRHQAVASVESADVPPQTVLHEHQPGYLLHDRILRAAMVTVAVAPTKAPEPNAATEEGEHHG